MPNKIAEYLLGVYMLALASLPAAQYVSEGKMTGEWNPRKQEWKQLAKLNDVVVTQSFRGGLYPSMLEEYVRDNPVDPEDMVFFGLLIAMLSRMLGKTALPERQYSIERRE